MPPPRITGRPEPSCLFPDENEIAHCVLGSERSRTWKGLAIVLERHGLPKIDPMFGGRYWPKVRAFLDGMNHLDQSSTERIDGPERQSGKRTGGVRPRS